MSVGCPFQVATGWWCPFCGATRAASRIVRADLSGALRYNALLVIAAPDRRSLSGGRTRSRPSRAGERACGNGSAPASVATAAVLGVAFTVVRNIPVDPLTSLRFPGA